MTRFVPALAFLVLIGGSAPRPAATQDTPPDLEKKIATAIDKGVEWLKKRQKSDGCFDTSSGPVYGGGNQPAHPNKLGNTALALLALLKSEVDPKDPVITKGFKFMYEYMNQNANTRSTYEKAVTLMAIESLYEAYVIAKMKKDGKKPTDRAGDSKEPAYTINGNDAKIASTIVKDLVKEQTKKGGWRYGGDFVTVGSDEDISATQIMLLGLKSATRMRLPVNNTVFDKAMKFILSSQEKDGPKIARPGDATGSGPRDTYVSGGEDRARGWAYELKSDNPEETKTTGAMTCAGLGGLLICKSVLGKNIPAKLNKDSTQAIFDGFAWLHSHWTMSENPGGRRSHYYFLYGIERVGTMGLYEKIGKHIWFKEGAEVLVEAQAKDGHWTDEEVEPRDLYASCFALLFLKKGTVPIGDVITGDRYGTPSPQPSASPAPSPSPEPPTPPEKE